MATSTWQSSACDRCGRDVHRGVRCDCLAPYRVFSYQTRTARLRDEWTTWDPADSRIEAALIASEYHLDGFFTTIIERITAE